MLDLPNLRSPRRRSLILLLVGVLVLPAILAGGLLGILLVHRISQKAFNAVVRVLAIAAGAYLCI